MENRGRIFLIVALLLVWPIAGDCAGIFAGFEFDDEEQHFYYLGLSTDGEYFFNVLASHNRYEFEDNGELRLAKIKSLSPGVGLRREGPLTWMVSAGPVVREKDEETDEGSSSKTEIGALFQLDGFWFRDNESLRLQATFSTLDTFLWSRLRGKKRIYGVLHGGAEVFWMGNSDFDAWGIGPILEISMEGISAVARWGLKESSTFNGGMYAGIELYTPL
ncbi:MAG: hypothetical protein ACWGN7_03720 [Thermodesulfovibrionales bacterium]